jgi:hypothetical protein
MGVEIIYDTKEDQCIAVGKQGTTWQISVRLYQDEAMTIPMDLTGYVARGQIRKSYIDTNIVASFNWLINGNEVVYILPPDVTAGIPAYQKNVSMKMLPKWEEGVDGCYVFDCEIDNQNGYVERVLEGILFVDPEVTK